MNIIPYVEIVLLWLYFFSAEAQSFFNQGKQTRICEAGNECQEFGKCKKMTKGRKARLQRCKFHREKLYVCCPKILELTQDATIVQPPDTNFDCGKRGSIPISFKTISLMSKKNMLHHCIFQKQPAIASGVPTFKYSWPWMVLLVRKRESPNRYFCSGVLINQNYVLTAAHCVEKPESFFVRAGEHDYSVPKDPKSSTPPEDVGIRDIKLHPKYELSKGYFDIALVKLERPIQFRKEIGPVCLPWGETATTDLMGKRVTITGWGATQFGGPSSPVLRELEVSIFDPSVCHRSYMSLRYFRRIYPHGMKKNNILCAGNTQEGKDSCQGDSGGPLVHQTLDSRFTLAGIISKGYGCGKKGFPGLNIPIRHRKTLQWIKDVAF